MALPPGLDEVHQQSFDVGAVQVLVAHDHDRSVPETLWTVLVPLLQRSTPVGDICDRFVRHAYKKIATNHM